MLPTKRPTLAQMARETFDSERYWFEANWDGLRCLAFMDRWRVRLSRRELVELSAPFPDLAPLARLRHRYA